MASPLAVFRKYQKILLAVFGVALMLVFTVGGLVSQYLGASQGGQVEDTVAASWQDGQLRESELQMHRYARNQLRLFQESVIQMTTQRAGTPRVVVVPNTNAEASIVESLVLAQKARQLGIVVGDEAVLQHLVTHLSDDTISRDELAGILQQVTGGRMTQQQLFESLRTELLAHQLRILVNGAAFDGSIADTSVSPGESFDYFTRLHRSMEAEVMSVAVADFVDEVQEEPTEAEINELYEEYKDTYPSPISPTPGFRQPMRAAFQWLKADFAAFLDAEVAKVTEEQIVASYEENKNSYRKIELPSNDDIGADPETPNDADEPASSDLDDGQTTPPADADDDNVESDVVPAPGEAEGTAETEPDEAGAPASTDPLPAADSGQEQTTESSASPAADGPSRRYQEESEGDQAAEVDEVAAETVPETSTEGPGGDGDDPAAAEPATSETENAAASGEKEDLGQEAEIEYQPLEEVRDDIARQLARPLALTALTDAVDSARAALKKYFQSYVYWEAAPEEERGERPVPPDFAELGKKLNMVHGEIPLINALEADEYDLGRAFELDFSTGQIRRLPFTQMGFSRDLPLYQPRSISASDVDSKYVFWKVEEEKEFVPTLEQARADIIRHWKMKKAIPLARAKAEEYTSQARAKEQSLRALFGEEAELQVTDTGEFTWMTFGSTPTGAGAPRLGFVEGTEFAGEEFMRDVSALEPGELGVSINYPETTVYVVYMKTVSGKQEDLQERFLRQGMNMPILFMARQDQMRTATGWYENLEESVALRWHRPPLPDSGPVR